MGAYMYKIMIIEDDLTIAEVLSNSLVQWGYTVTIVEDFSRIMEQFCKETPDLVLLDISLPFYNGYYWCTEIRKISKVPVIFISSNTSNMDIVMAINMGGDEFITKPFDMTVTLAKIQGMLRRTYSFTTQTNIIEYRGLVLKIEEQTAWYQSNKIDLTKNEYRILHILMQNIGKVVTREELMKRLWDDEAFVDDNTLTVNITRLRKKTDEAGMKELIHTKKGIGYLIEE